MRKNRNLKAIYINRFKEMWPEFTRISAQCLAVLKQEIQQIQASGDVAPPGCRVMRYQVKTKTGKYWYYKLQALEPIFATRQGDGKLSKYKHLGKAGSPPHIGAVLQVTKRNQILELQRAINSLSDSWLEVVFEPEKDSEKAKSK